MVRCAALAVAIVVMGVGSGRAGTAAPPATGSAVQISAGLAHTCALTGVHAVRCWGSNGHGELGNASPTDSSRPVAVSGLPSGVTVLAAGVRHHCALTRVGAVKCWGHNSFGTLGDGTTIRRSSPVDVAGLSSGVTQIAAGHDHTCALTVGGGVKCWGYNGVGALGDGTTVDRWTPVDVAGLSSGVTAIAAGFGHSCAVTGAGGVKCWGSVAGGPVPRDVPGLSSGVSSIATSGSHSCALLREGRVKCWGRNNAGQLGDGTHTDRATPVDVVGLGRSVGAIRTGAATSCALLLTTRAVRCWGLNDHGQLGNGTTVDSATPAGVAGLSGGVAGIAVGSFHSCALTDRGGVKCWGSNASGQLGDGSTVDRRAPAAVFGLGERASLAILSRSARVTPARVASIELRCGSGAACTGRAVLTAYVDGELVASAASDVQLELGRRTFSIAPGRTQSVTIGLTRRSFGLLVRLRRLSARAHVRYKQPAGGRTIARRAVSLRAP